MGLKSQSDSTIELSLSVYPITVAYSVGWCFGPQSSLTSEAMTSLII
ncbi:MAG: hypothetical protein ACI814_004666, partial [Mariniblastus sp.]